MSMKPVVAHFNWTFFVKSETFIYNYISNLNNFRSICLAKNFENLDLFSFPEKSYFKICMPKNKKEKLSFILFQRYRSIIEVLKKEKVVLLHAHFGPNGVFALPFAKKMKLPLVTTFYGKDISKLAREERWLKKYKILFKEGSLFLVEGPFMRNSVIELGCPEEKIKIQKIAIEITKVKFRERLHKKDGEKIIFIFSGRFVEKKGLIYALQALKEVRKKYSNFEFRIIGDGLLKDSILDYIRINSMEAYVKLLGFLNYSEYLKEMEKADIFIHPSVTARDGDSEGGAPTTILEAQAMGMPVISTYHADIPNICVPEKTALLCEERDVNGLINKIEQIISQQSFWAQMSHAGRDFVSRFHSLDNAIPELERKYRALLD